MSSGAHPLHLAPQPRLARVLLPSAVVVRLLGVVTILATIAMRAAQIVRAPVTKDEFEHLHGAYLVHRGQTPYRDFFQHHPPFYYLTMGRMPIFRSGGWTTLLAARGLAVGMSLLVIAVIAGWARDLIGSSGAALAGVIVAADAFYARNGSRAFLDSFAVLGVVAGGWLLTRVLRDPRRRWEAAASGACFMAALLTTQKLVYLGIAVAAVLLTIVRGEPRTGRLAVLRFVGGGLIVAVATALLLGPSGVRQMIDDTVVLNLRWKASHRSLADLRGLARTGVFVYGLAALNVARTALAVSRRRGRIEAMDVPGLLLLAYGVAYLALPVVWEEFFVSPVPLAALAAALEITRILENRWPTPVLGAVLCLGAIALPLLWQGRSLRFDAVVDRERLELVERITPSDAPVFDTYSGYGAFRPHVYRYWLLHDEMQLMIEPSALERDLLDALRTQRPTVALEDEFSALLPPGVRAELTRLYRPTAVDGVWCRLDGPAACGPLGAARSFGEPSAE